MERRALGGTDARGGILSSAWHGALAQMPASAHAHAEQLLSRHVEPLVREGVEAPSWVEPHRFWYRPCGAGGQEFCNVGARDGSRQPLFDHTAVAAMGRAASVTFPAAGSADA